MGRLSCHSLLYRWARSLSFLSLESSDTPTHIHPSIHASIHPSDRCSPAIEEITPTNPSHGAHLRGEFTSPPQIRCTTNNRTRR
mmetsp:Transcript_16162/g.38674  ORF Transcript_16162/g.38674 Transcript_16162/m.38674 type:complete len:84 (-) Transcript_16162:58-309(-)